VLRSRGPQHSGQPREGRLAAEHFVIACADADDRAFASRGRYTDGGPIAEANGRPRLQLVRRRRRSAQQSHALGAHGVTHDLRERGGQGVAGETGTRELMTLARHPRALAAPLCLQTRVGELRREALELVVDRASLHGIVSPMACGSPCVALSHGPGPHSCHLAVWPGPPSHPAVGRLWRSSHTSLNGTVAPRSQSSPAIRVPKPPEP